MAAENRKGCPRNDLEATVKLLQDKYNCTVRVLADESNDLKAIFFQDEGMKRSFSNYPEIIFIDATYKLLETRMSCFLIVVEDGNGESEIVAVGLFMTEDGETLKWFFEVFKALNSKWDSIKVTMADKDIKERHVAARQERSHKAASMLQKKRVLKNSDKDHELYCQLLTPYAYKHIERQLRLSNEASAHSNSAASANDCECKTCR
ncbi:hypothetical protein HPB52_016536 [Rhipicephalus sanguineus]|uniref:ZSWIM1/3 RNaseH-like domain-containing protein n=1 Tax=Rhipicephalus sanguineus TaxID=34632 RepID=A0A9D4T167_RHISA|nr:hypothetical protein HPB52_016536 [Rhipicephalus sanguineus]